jgi:hypothetical protein
MQKNKIYNVLNRINAYFDFEDDKKPHWGQKGSSSRNLPPIHGNTLGCCGEKGCEIPKHECISHNVQNQMKKYGYAHDRKTATGVTIKGRNTKKKETDEEDAKNKKLEDNRNKKNKKEEKTETEEIEEKADDIAEKIINEETPKEKTDTEKASEKTKSILNKEKIKSGDIKNISHKTKGKKKIKGLSLSNINDYYDLIKRINIILK